MPDLSELTLLNLTSNDISDIHYDAFDGLDSLETLVLSHNKLSAIDDDIFEWNPLKLKASVWLNFLSCIFQNDICTDLNF